MEASWPILIFLSLVSNKWNESLQTDGLQYRVTAATTDSFTSGRRQTTNVILLLHTAHISTARKSSPCVCQGNWLEEGKYTIGCSSSWDAEVSKSILHPKSFSSIYGCFHWTFPGRSKCRAAVIGLRAHTNTQVTGKQNCQDDGTKPVKALSWDLKPRANTLSWVNARQAESNEIFSHVAG